MWLPFAGRGRGPSSSRGRGPADRHAEVPPGPPPWVPNPRLTAPTVVFFGLIAVTAISFVVSLGVAAWRFVEQATDPR